MYAGSWDGLVYVVDLRTGRLQWKFPLHPQRAVKPVPGVTPCDYDSDGGLVTSSAWFEPGSGNRPDLVLFGGGYTLYALYVKTGREVWAHDYTGRPERPPEPAKDDTRIFSSPVVIDGKVIIGLTSDGADDRRGYVVAASLSTGRPAWVHETNRDDQGAGPQRRLRQHLVVGLRFSRPGLDLLRQLRLPLRQRGGRQRSHLRPAHHRWLVGVGLCPPWVDVGCDYDFGASVNVGLDADGATQVRRCGRQGRHLLLTRSPHRRPALGHQRGVRRSRRRVHRHHRLRRKTGVRRPPASATSATSPTRSATASPGGASAPTDAP